MIPYTVQYNSTEYADGRVTYRARLMFGGTIPVLISDAGHKTERDALIGLAVKVIEQALDDTSSVYGRTLPTDLRDMVDDVLTHNYPKKIRAKVYARIRRREKQSLKERTV